MSASALPKQISSRPDAADWRRASDPLYSWDEELRSSPRACRRIWRTIWYAPTGGLRQVVILKNDSLLTVKEFWTIAKTAYEHTVYEGSDLSAAVDAANAAFDSFADTGHKSHTQYGVGIQEWFGYDFMDSWDRDVFSANKIADSLRRSQEWQDEQERAEEDRNEYLREQGLAPSAPVVTTGPRSRSSALAERQEAAA